jgi:hypothetical protein
MKASTLRVALASAVVAALIPIAWFANAVFALGLEITHEPNGTRVNVGWLGEYQSNLSEISIWTEPSGVLVWRARPTSDAIQAWSFLIAPGANPRALAGLGDNSSLKVVVPQSDSQVHFELGATYKVVITSAGGWPCVTRLTCREAEFRLR